MRDAVYVAVGTIDPDKTLNNVISWAKLIVIIAILAGIIRGGRKHGDGDTKGAISVLAVVVVVAIACAVALNPFGVGIALLNVFV